MIHLHGIYDQLRTHKNCFKKKKKYADQPHLNDCELTRSRVSNVSKRRKQFEYSRTTKSNKHIYFKKNLNNLIALYTLHTTAYPFRSLCFTTTSLHTYKLAK